MFTLLTALEETLYTGSRGTGIKSNPVTTTATETATLDLNTTGNKSFAIAATVQPLPGVTVNTQPGKSNITVILSETTR